MLHRVHTSERRQRLHGSREGTCDHVHFRQGGLRTKEARLRGWVSIFRRERVERALGPLRLANTLLGAARVLRCVRRSRARCAQRRHRTLHDPRRQLVQRTFLKYAANVNASAASTEVGLGKNALPHRAVCSVPSELALIRFLR